jgi:hypothetical protein
MADNYKSLYAGKTRNKQKIKAGKFKLLSEQEIRNLTDLQLLISIKQTIIILFSIFFWVADC